MAPFTPDQIFNPSDRSLERHVESEASSRVVCDVISPWQTEANHDLELGLNEAPIFSSDLSLSSTASVCSIALHLHTSNGAVCCEVTSRYTRAKPHQCVCSCLHSKNISPNVTCDLQKLISIHDKFVSVQTTKIATQFNSGMIKFKQIPIFCNFLGVSLQ